MRIGINKFTIGATSTLRIQSKANGLVTCIETVASRQSPREISGRVFFTIRGCNGSVLRCWPAGKFQETGVVRCGRINRAINSRTLVASKIFLESLDALRRSVYNMFWLYSSNCCFETDRWKSWFQSEQAEIPQVQKIFAFSWDDFSCWVPCPLLYPVR